MPASSDARRPRPGHRADPGRAVVASTESLADRRSTRCSSSPRPRPEPVRARHWAVRPRRRAMGKKSRQRQPSPPQLTWTLPHGEVRRRPPRALPLRVRPPLQGLPRRGPPGTPPAFVARPFEGLAERVRLGRAARDRPGRDAPPDPGRTTPTARRRSPPCCRWPGRGWCARTARSSSGCRSSRLRRRQPRRGRRPSSGAGRRAGTLIGRPTDPGAGRPAAGPARPTAPLEVRCTSGFDFWLDGVEDPTARWSWPSMGANEAVVPTVRLTSVEAAYWFGSGTAAPALGLRTTRTRCSTRWPGCTPRGADLVGEGRATSGRSGRTAWWCRSGTCPRAPARALEEPRRRVRRPAGRGDGATTPLTRTNGPRAPGCAAASSPCAEPPPDSMKSADNSRLAWLSSLWTSMYIQETARPMLLPRQHRSGALLLGGSDA